MLKANLMEFSCCYKRTIYMLKIEKKIIKTNLEQIKEVSNISKLKFISINFFCINFKLVNKRIDKSSDSKLNQTIK